MDKNKATSASGESSNKQPKPIGAQKVKADIEQRAPLEEVLDEFICDLDQQFPLLGGETEPIDPTIQLKKTEKRQR